MPDIAVAYHEAGHAVIGQKLGVPVRRVSIEPTEAYRGMVLIDDPVRGIKDGDETSDRARLRVERTIIVRLAGPVAQRKHRPSSWRRYHGSDDYRGLAGLAACFYDGETLDAFIRWLELRTQDLVEIHMSAIDRVAQALLERKTLTSDEIKEIAWPPEIPMPHLKGARSSSSATTPQARVARSSRR